MWDSRATVTATVQQNYNVRVNVTASAPTRIDLAGGTIDIWPLYLFHDGAQTLNAAISLRAHVQLESRDDGLVEIVSEDTGLRVTAESRQALRADETLPLLARLADAFDVKGLVIRTRGESPAGAGIAGSSALNVAVCGALARWSGSTADPEALLVTAMNVEAQAIKVPTGLQDYRPAMYGGIAALELGAHGLKRVALAVDPLELQQRIVLCYTGAPRNSGTNNWEITKRHIDGDRHVFDCFERIRDTAAGMRRALERGDWDATARHLSEEWNNRKRLAPGVSTPVIDDLIARAIAAGAQAAKVCGAGGGGCLFCLVPPGEIGRGPRGAGRRRGAAAGFPDRDRGVASRRMPLDNLAVARILGEIGDLLELKGENPFKIRAYRNGADVVAHQPEQAASRDESQLRAWPGIGKDLAARIREIAATGTCGIHQDLLAQFPSTLLELMRLQGVGPKTVALLYGEMRITSIDDLEAAARAGRLRALKGMGARKEQLLLQALEERKQHVNRHLLAHADEVATAIVAYLTDQAPGITFEIVGSLRRGVETIGDIDILATAPLGTGTVPIFPGLVGGNGDSPRSRGSVMAAFTSFPLVERVLGEGDTKSSVLIRGGFQADLRLVAPESRGAAQQYFTGSKAHNIALRDRALERGMKLNEYGLFRAADEARLAGETEEGIYEALAMPWIPPELRENRGEISAALERRLPHLVTAADFRGDLHMHTTETDGKDELEAMVLAARDAGLEYIAITDHSKALAMANGLDEKRALAHAARIRALDARVDGIRVLAGIECDILADGSMDLAADCLAELDLVIGSVHSAMRQETEEMTARLVRAIEHPWVDIIGHPTSRMLLKREPAQVQIEVVARAAAAHGVALEINSQPHRLDLCDTHARLAREHGARLIVSTDAHSRAALGYRRWGVLVARRAWLASEDLLNTLPYDDFRRALRRNRSRAA